MSIFNHVVEFTLAERLDRLEASRVDIARRIAEVDAQRGDLAFEAAGGDAKASRNLDRLDAELKKLIDKGDRVDLAVTAARARIEAAEAKETATRRRQVADRIVALLDRRVEIAGRADELLSALSSEFAELTSLADEINDLRIVTHQKSDKAGNQGIWEQHFSQIAFSSRVALAASLVGLRELSDPDISPWLNGRSLKEQETAIRDRCRADAEAYAAHEGVFSDDDDGRRPLALIAAARKDLAA